MDAWEEDVRQFMLDEEEADDELFNLLMSSFSLR
jgi:hypothetical protein